MPTINVTVRNRIATAQRWQCIICGNSDYIVDFDLDDEWNDMPNKVAVSELKPETSAPLHRHMRKTNQTGQPYYLNVYEVEMYESDY